MSNIKNILSTAWESTLCRFTIIALALGAAPFYFLSMAVATLAN
jgi:hypothetical protein